MNNQYEQDEISLIDLMQVLSKRKMLIIKVFAVVTALAVLFAFLPFFEREKEYEAISSMSIIYDFKTPADPEQIGEGYVYYQDRMENIMIPTIKGYAQSLTLLRNVIKDLGLVNDKGEPIKDINLAKNIKIENQENSNVIRISVTYKDEEEAAAIANLIPQKLLEMSQGNLELRDYNIHIIDTAVANEAESSGGKLLTLAIGMVLGLMLGVFAAFAKEYMNKKIGSRRDIAAIGLDTELERTGPVNKDILENILMLANLSNAKSIAIAAEPTSLAVISELYTDMLKDLSYKTKMINYSDEALPEAGNMTTESGETTSKNNVKLLSENKLEDSIISLENKEQDDSQLLIKIISLYDDRYPLIAKQSDKAFLIVEQEKTDKKTMESLSHIASKYSIDISVIYLT